MANVELKKELTDSQLNLLNAEMQNKKTNPIIVWLLWFFVGTLGIHAYYLGDKSRGNLLLGLYILGWATIWIFGLGAIFFFVAFILWIIDAIKMQQKIEEKNDLIELKIINTILSK